MSVEVIHGDALALPVADNSVDLIVTSPPYFGLRSYQDGGEHYEGQIGAEATPAKFVDALVAATAEMVRVLKPSGSIFVNLGDKYSQRTAMRRSSHQDGLQPDRADLAKDWKASRERGEARMPYQNVINPETGAYVREKSLIGVPWRYALRCMDDLDLILRAEIVWSKPNGLPESVADRVRRSHETWFHLTKSPRYYANIDTIREPHLTPGIGGGRRNEGAAFDAAGKHGSADGSRHLDGNPLGKLPGSVRVVPTQPLKLPPELGVQHFAAFPMAWPRWFIQGWCPPGGTVLDPFGGTGTTATVAHALGRHGITVDLSHDYCRVARWRTTDPKQLLKAAG